MALKSAGGNENDCCDNVQELRKETSTKQKRLWNIFTMASYILQKEPMVVPGRTQHELQLDRTLKIFRTTSQQYVLNCWANVHFPSTDYDKSNNTTFHQQRYCSSGHQSASNAKFCAQCG